MKQDVLFIGIGQAGSNIAYEMKKKGFQTFYINSTNDDVNLLDISDNLKYHIPGATGCGRNRGKALNYTREHFTDIENLIMTKFPMFKHIYVCFSTGGGTGSGISPILLSILSKKYQNKNFGYVAVLPSRFESIDIKSNALECYTQLQKLENISNSFFLDNNNDYDDYIEINKIFADEFDRFSNITANKSVKGNIDDDELEKLMSTKGNVVFASYDGSELKVSEIFTQNDSRCEKAFVINGNLNPITIEHIADKFSKPIRLFKGYNDNLKDSYAGIFGLDLPTARLVELQEEVLKDNDEIKKLNEEKISEVELGFYIPDSLKSQKESIKKEVVDIDIEDEFKKFMAF